MVSSLKKSRGLFVNARLSKGEGHAISVNGGHYYCHCSANCGINVIFFYAPTIFEQSGVGTNAAFMQAVWIGLVNVAFTVVAMLTIDKWEENRCC